MTIPLITGLIMEFRIKFHAIMVASSGGSDSNVKQQVKDAVEEVFGYLGIFVEPEGDY